jgi:uncharacterized protein
VQLRWLLDTNGTLLNGPSLDWLSSKKLTSKVFVSLDGIAKAHDLHRMDTAGRPTHFRVLKALELLRARAIPFDIVAVICPDTAHYLSQSLEFLLKLGAERIQFQVNLRAKWGEVELSEFAEQSRHAAQIWAEEFRKGQKRVVEPLHNKVLSHLFGSLHLPNRCQLATREVAVAPSGRIYPCAEMVGDDNREELVIGDVSTGLEIERVLKLRVLTQNVIAICDACEIRNRCLNGCGCRQWACAGRLGQVTASLCETESAWIDAADLAAEMLVAENCTAFHEFYYERPWAVPEPARGLGSELVQIRRS